MYWTLKQVLRWLAWGLLVSIIIFYAFYQSRGVREGPLITLSTPTNGETLHTPLVRVSGSATQAKEITLDGRPIFVDINGHFDEQLLLTEGYNIIELTAKDTGGNETQKTIELVFVPETASSSVATTSSTAVEGTDTPVIH